MATPDAPLTLAIFCDYENVAIGARDEDDKFDIRLVDERLLNKGRIVLRKAYADWGRFPDARRTLHEASYELIEVPHTRWAGKNSADIRLVVDALDLCYTKTHVDAFVVISGDSDFSPVVSKLRENNKTVIGMGVKSSTSDLLVANCDEFIYYDDIVVERHQQVEEEEETLEDQPKALRWVWETANALARERDGKLWASMVKQTLKRKRPNFSETTHGYRNFSALLEDGEKRGMFELQKDERSGGYLITDTLVPDGRSRSRRRRRR